MYNEGAALLPNELTYMAREADSFQITKKHVTVVLRFTLRFVVSSTQVLMVQGFFTSTSVGLGGCFLRLLLFPPPHTTG